MPEAIMNLPTPWPRWDWQRQHTTTLIVGALHAALVYGVHQSMQHMPPVVTEGAQLISQIEVIAAPPTVPPPAPTITTNRPPKPEVKAQPKPLKAAPARPVLSTEAPSPHSAVAAPQPKAAPAPTTATAPTASAQAVEPATTSANTAATTQAKAPEPAVEQPSSKAQYLKNPKPPYPPTSRRLGEEGKVVIRVLISAEGLPSQAQIHKSSGFERLDQAALETIERWRFVPGKRGGVPEAMWFNVPFDFILD